jgi:hypothetical protein
MNDIEKEGRLHLYICFNLIFFKENFSMSLTKRKESELTGTFIQIISFDRADAYVYHNER